ncbi:hypothetical protein TYRP_009837, partial [Tyrophagus putrescentiae]
TIFAPQFVVELGQRRAEDLRVVLGGLEERLHLDGLEVGRLAEQIGQRQRVPDTEAARLSAVLKVETVTELPVVKLDAVQTAKGRPQNGAEGLHLGEAAHEEINVAELLDALLGNEANQIGPAGNLGAGAVLEEVDVGGHAVLSPAVDVDGGQVDDGRVARVEEKEVLDVGDDELVGHVARLLEEAAEDAVGVARPDVRHLEELVAQEEGVGGGGLVEDVEDAEDLRVAHAEAGHGGRLDR